MINFLQQEEANERRKQNRLKEVNKKRNLESLQKDAIKRGKEFEKKVKMYFTYMYMYYVLWFANLANNMILSCPFRSTWYFPARQTFSCGHVHVINPALAKLAWSRWLGTCIGQVLFWNFLHQPLRTKGNWTCLYSTIFTQHVVR